MDTRDVELDELERACHNCVHQGHSVFHPACANCVHGGGTTTSSRFIPMEDSPYMKRVTDTFEATEDIVIYQSPPTSSTVEHTGGSSSYYRIHITKPIAEDQPEYTAECLDIIEALKMTNAEANNFKATWRKAAARLGKEKGGNNAKYDAEKCVFFSGRMLAEYV